MAEVTDQIQEIEKTFIHLESFWGEEVPEALSHDGWSDYELLDWVEEARGIPNVHYERLMGYLQGETKKKYQERLNKLDKLIETNKPKLLKLLNS